MLNDRTRLLFIVVTCVAFAVLIAYTPAPAIQPWVQREVRQLDGQLMNQPVPPLEIIDAEGRTINLAKLRGRVVFLNLWKSDCKPCREELPSMLRLAGHLNQSAPDDFIMVAVSWDDDPQALSDFLAQIPGIRSQVIIGVDPGGELTRQLGTELLPETYIIDKRGRLIARFQNQRQWDDEAALNLMTSLIHEPD